MARFKAGSRTEREIVWPVTEFSLAQPAALERDLIVGVAIEPHLKWRTYCAAVLELARRTEASLVLTLGALLAEVAHTQPVRLVGSAPDPALAARLGLRPSRYEGPTGIVGVLNTICREEGIATASLWANVPHYISGIENPKAALALVRRTLILLHAEADLSELAQAASEFEQNLNGIVAQNAKIAEYVVPPREEEAGGATRRRRRTPTSYPPRPISWRRWSSSSASSGPTRPDRPRADALPPRAVGSGRSPPRRSSPRPAAAAGVRVVPPSPGQGDPVLRARRRPGGIR